MSSSTTPKKQQGKTLAKEETMTSGKRKEEGEGEEIKDKRIKEEKEEEEEEENPGNDSKNGNNTNETAALVGPNDVPTDRAVLATLLACCEVHEALAFFSSSPSSHSSAPPPKNKPPSSSSSSSWSWSQWHSSFFAHASPRPSTSLYDVFDLSPLESCRALEAWGRDEGREDNNNDNGDGDGDGGDDEDSTDTGGTYKDRYRRPGKYESTAPLPRDWGRYVLQTQRCVRDMVLWVSEHHDAGTGSSDADAASGSRGSGTEQTERKKGGETGHGHERVGEDEKKGAKSDANSHPHRRSSLALDAVLQISALLSSPDTRDVYSRYLLTHIETAKKWERGQTALCVQTKTEKMIKARDEKQARKEKEKHGKE
ncbi:hypothetical protein EKO27_g2694, partial [Xylaria grammica]